MTTLDLSNWQQRPFQARWLAMDNFAAQGRQQRRLEDLRE